MKPSRRVPQFEQLDGRQLLAAVNIPTDLSGQVSALVSTPVVIDNAIGVRAVTIRLNYDPNVLSLSQSDVRIGTAWNSAGDTQITANIDQNTGSVVIFLSASANLPATAGSLANLGFAVRSGVSSGTVSRVDLSQVRLNEGAIAVNPNPISGADATDGVITVTTGTPDNPDGTTSLSGVVFADTNEDALPGLFEGIPGVQLTLVNVTSGSSRATTTGSDGTYQFNNLSSGAYRLVQTQPNPYLDGGFNQLDVTLSTGQNLANQNFKELGLRPEFVHNRLLTSLVMPIGSTAWLSTVSALMQRPLQSASTPTPLLQSALVQSPSNQSLVSNNSSEVPNHALGSAPGVSSIQAEGESSAPSAKPASVANAQAWSLQSIRRSKDRTSSQFVDETFASELAFE